MESQDHLPYEDHRVEMQSMESLASTYSRKQEEEKKKLFDSFVINHEGKFKVVWDWFVLILVIFTAIQIPYYAAFYEKQKILLDINRLEKIEAILIITGMVDCMFILDIFINFRTTYIQTSSDKLEREPRMIAVHYLKSWFLIDLLAAIPFDWIMYEQEEKEGGNTSALIGLLKSARLLRLFRVARKLDRYSEYGLAVFFLLMCLFTLFAHWLACIWNYVALEEKDNRNSWVRRMDADLYPASIAKEACNCINGTLSALSNSTVIPYTIQMTRGQRYIASLYFIVSSLTSVGFGNIAASTEIEQTFAVIVMLVGALMYACIFGNMVAIVQRLYLKASVFHNNMNTVREFMRFYKISEPLQTSINNYIRRDWAASQGVQADIVLQRFPDCIQADLTYELYQRVFYNVKPLRGATVSCMRALSMKFKTITLQENHMILRQGEEINRFYIVGKGSLEVLLRGDLVAVLTKNSTFGFDIEKSHIRNKSNANVRAERLVQIHFIDKSDLLEIIHLYPRFAKSFRRKCKHSYDLNDPEEEGYFQAPPKKDKTHVGAMARQALGMPFMTRFNGRFTFKKRRDSNLQDMEALSESCLYKTNVKVNGNTTLNRRLSMSHSEINTPISDSSFININSCNNLKPIIKTYAKQQILRNTDSEIGSLSSVRFTDVTEKRKCMDTDVEGLEHRMAKLEEKVERINTTLDDRFTLILKRLNEIKGRDCVHKNCVSTTYSAGHGMNDKEYEREVPWDGLPLAKPDEDEDIVVAVTGENKNRSTESVPFLHDTTL